MNDPRLYKIRAIHESVKYTGVGFFTNDGFLVVGGEHVEDVPFLVYNTSNYYEELRYVKELLRKQFHVHYPELKDRIWVR